VTIMHSQIKRLTLVMNSRLLQASTKPAGSQIRDSLLARVEVVSCPAAVVSMRRYGVFSVAETRP